MTRFLVTLAVVLSQVGPLARAPRADAIGDRLGRYLRGDFDVVLATIGTSDLEGLLGELREDGQAWIDRGDPARRNKRRLAAATLALEAARLGTRTGWKRRDPFIIRTNEMHGAIKGAPSSRNLGETLAWEPPARLLEWGCSLFRTAAPSADERLWQLAAVAVAERARDYEFLAGALVRGRPTDAPINAGAEIEHLKHVRARFPREPRFQLAAAFSLDLAVPGGAQSRAAFSQLQDDDDVGAEASLRLAEMRARASNDDGPIAIFNKADAKTLDPWILYLARYLKGQALERRNRIEDAETAYRGALAAAPGAESASIALAALLFKTDRRTEAATISEALLLLKPPAPDPWRTYGFGDDRLWPELLTRLHGEITR